MEKQAVPGCLEPASGRSDNVRLRYVSAEGVLQLLQFDGHPYLVIGRSQAANIVLDDPCVSHRHAGIGYCNGQFIVVDLGSTNGTFHNGVRVSDSHLHDGDVIRVGHTLLVFRQLGVQEALLGPPPVVAALPQPPAQGAADSTAASQAATATTAPPASAGGDSVRERFRRRMQAWNEITSGHQPAEPKAVRLVPIAPPAKATKAAAESHSVHVWFFT